MITLIFSDSIGWGAFDHKNGGWAERFKRRQFKEDDFVYNCAISGNTTSHVVCRMENEIRSRKDPDDDLRLIFAIGINDASRIDDELRVSQDKFLANISEIIKMARQHTDDITFIGLTCVNELKSMPVAWQKNLHYDNEDITLYNSLLQTRVAIHRIPFIRTIDLLDNSCLKDGVHPNEKGHDKLFRKICSCL